MADYQSWALIIAVAAMLYQLGQIANRLQEIGGVLRDIRANLRGAFPGAEKNGRLDR